MSRKGNCLDNAPMESFFSSLQTKVVHRTRFKIRREAKAAYACFLGRIAFTGSLKYIEIFYYRQRSHSSIGYRTPEQARLDLTTKMAA